VGGDAVRDLAGHRRGGRAGLHGLGVRRRPPAVRNDGRLVRRHGHSRRGHPVPACPPQAGRAGRFTQAARHGRAAIPHSRRATGRGRGRPGHVSRICQLADTPVPRPPARASVSSGDGSKSQAGRRRNDMPRLGRTTGPGKRASARPGGGRFSTRARVVAGAVAALAVLAVLAAAALAGSGHPTPAPAPSGTGGPAGASGAAQAAPPGARTSSAGAANPNPSAHPVTGPTPPPIAAALTLGRPDAPVAIVEFGDYQCTSCGAFARDTEPVLIRRYVDTGVVRLLWRGLPLGRRPVGARRCRRAGRRRAGQILGVPRLPVRPPVSRRAQRPGHRRLPAVGGAAAGAEHDPVQP